MLPILSYLAKTLVLGVISMSISIVILPETCQILSDFLNLEVFIEY